MAKMSRQTLKRLASNKRGAAKSARTYTPEVKSAKTPSPKTSKSASKVAKGVGLAGAAKVAGAAAIPIGIAAATSAPALYEMKRQKTPLSEKEKTRKEELSKSFNKHSKSERAEYIKLTAREGRTSKSAPKSEIKPKEMPKAEMKKGGEVKTNGITKPAVSEKKTPSKVSTPEKPKTSTEKKSGSVKWTPELNRLVKERERAKKEGKSDYSKHLQNLINEKMGSKVRHEVKGTDRPAKKAETYTDTHTGAKTEIVSRSNLNLPKPAKKEVAKTTTKKVESKPVVKVAKKETKKNYEGTIRQVRKSKSGR